MCAESTDPCCGSDECEGCVDDADGASYVPVPECYREAIECDTVECSEGSRLHSLRLSHMCTKHHKKRQYPPPIRRGDGA